MSKIRELSLSERTAVKHLREVGLSYAEIAQQVGCTKSAAFKSIKLTRIRARWRKGQEQEGQSKHPREENVPFAKRPESSGSPP